MNLKTKFVNKVIDHIGNYNFGVDYVNIRGCLKIVNFKILTLII